MGRKIRPRKHRGVKDPLIQLARRNACPSINAPPSKPDFQELPKTVLEIQRLCAIAESRSKPGQGKKKHPNSRSNPIDSLHLYDKDPKLPGMRRKDRDIPRVVQMDNEPDEAYLLRFSAAAQDFMNEVQLENKHDTNLEVESNEKDKDDSESKEECEEKKSSNNEASNSKKREQDFDALSTQFNVSRRNKRSRFGKNPLERVTKPNKKERRKQRLANIKKEEHHEDELGSSDEEIDFSMLKDEVKFGEVVHRPPQLSVKPRGSEVNAKPGTKDLLLKQIFSAKSKDSKNASPKNLSNAQKYFLEKERIRVVQAYRDLKASKIKKI